MANDGTDLPIFIGQYKIFRFDFPLQSEVNGAIQLMGLVKVLVC